MKKGFCLFVISGLNGSKQKLHVKWNPFIPNPFEFENFRRFVFSGIIPVLLWWNKWRFRNFPLAEVKNWHVLEIPKAIVFNSCQTQWHNNNSNYTTKARKRIIGIQASTKLLFGVSWIDLPKTEFFSTTGRNLEVASQLRAKVKVHSGLLMPYFVSFA